MKELTNMKGLVQRARRLGLKPLDIAFRIGCTPDTVYKWEQEYSHRPMEKYRRALENLVENLESGKYEKVIH